MERRLLLFAFLSIIVWMLSMNYINQKYPSRRPGQTGQKAGTNQAAGGTGASAGTTTGTTQTATGPAGNVPAPESYPVGPSVRVTTDVYDIVFSTNGAVPVSWDVIDPRYAPKDLDMLTTATVREHLIDPDLAKNTALPNPFETVLQELNSRYYNEFNEMVFTHEQLDANGLVHRFTSPANETGVSMTKTWTFERGGFMPRLEVVLNNQGQSNINFGGGGRGLGLTLGPGIGGDSNAAHEIATPYSTVDAVVYARDAFLRETLSKVRQGGTRTLGETITLDETRDIGPIYWGGLANKYYLSVLIPDEANPISAAEALLDSRVQGKLTADPDLVGQFPIIELYTAPFTLGPGQTSKFSYSVYVGPKQRQELKLAGHELDRAMFHYSGTTIRSICLVLLPILYWLYSFLANWGLAIIFLTVIVRLLTLPLVHKGMKSQAKMSREMNKIRPLMDKINEKYKNDPARKQQEIMKLYREHNINPLGMMKGCVWMLIQLPIFIGLYALLYQVIDLRGADFLWIRDLSQPDRLFRLPFHIWHLGGHFNLLPIIVAGTQVLTSKFMQTPATDPQQEQIQKMMTYMMPVMILFFTYPFPSGLMLYWLVSNAWQVVQQVYVNKVIKRPEAGATAQ